MYAIVDIETTGGSPERSKIIEIAIVIHDGIQVVKNFSSLVNPRCSIPYFITKITGITEEMLYDAPQFHEIAKEIVELTEDKIFVAHNARFDYGFVKAEFKDLGYNFQRKTLCTVRLSRLAFAGLPSYSLGNLCESLNIRIKDRHRALGDAEATAVLFGKIIETKTDLTSHEKIKSEVRKTTFPPHLKEGAFHSIPESATGVYYFHNNAGEVIYVGKSIDIKKRLLQHFGNNKGGKTVRLHHEICDISYESTGSELVALLLESDEIKKLRPLYNSSQKRTKSVPYYGIYDHYDPSGYINFSIAPLKANSEQLATADNLTAGKNILFRIAEKYNLCYSKCGLNTSGACFNYHLHKCEGACIEQETSENYNEKVLKAMNDFSFRNESFFIIDKGRDKEERAVVFIDKGEYKGFGYVDISMAQPTHLDFRDCIKKYNHNKDIQNIIFQYLKKGTEKINLNEMDLYHAEEA